MASRISLHLTELRPDLIKHITDYWVNSDPEFLESMGVDLAKVPKAEDLRQVLLQQLSLPDEEKRAFALIWYIDNNPVGHCNLNPISYGEEAWMHLHMWDRKNRKRGMGTELVRMSIPIFFERFHLKRLYCEPYARNSPPNRTLERVGFTFLKEYVTIPGSINFMQPVRQWVFNREDFHHLQ